MSSEEFTPGAGSQIRLKTTTDGVEEGDVGKVLAVDAGESDKPKDSNEMIRILQEINQKLATLCKERLEPSKALSTDKTTSFNEKSVDRKNTFIDNWQWRPYIPTFARNVDPQILGFLGKMLPDKIGNFWAVPFDGRIALKLSSFGLRVSSAEVPAFDRDLTNFTIENKAGTQDLEAEVNAWGAFHEGLREKRDRKFQIIDYDPWSNRYLLFPQMQSNESSTLPSLGYQQANWDARWLFPKYWASTSEEGAGDQMPFRLVTGASQNQYCPWHGMANGSVAPWRRLIKVNGAGPFILHDMLYDRDPDSTDPNPCPYFEFESPKGRLLDDAIAKHIFCEKDKEPSMSNKYLNQELCFQLTFYEIIESPSSERGEREWKSLRGMYTKLDESERLGKDRYLQRSAWTIYLTTEDKNNSPFWPVFTLIMLSPDNFDCSESLQLGILSSENRLTAELLCISSGLQHVVTKWTELLSYFEDFLGVDILKPHLHYTLIFDDENFTRIQKYSWTIACLREFDRSISENIKQWDLFFEAKIKNLIEDPNLGKLLDATRIERDKNSLPDSQMPTPEENFRKYLAASQTACRVLVDIQVLLKVKLETTKEIRDALFGASGLVHELRENLKLLTYVSIFFLPLAYCAALWAIPNISEHATRKAFIGTTIGIGLATYLVVLNLERLSINFKRCYYRMRVGIIIKITQDQGLSWEESGRKFASFRHQKERTAPPSEWWILIYCIWSLFVSIFKKKKSRRQTTTAAEP
ncbi:hypothetical protein V8E51_014776 [Hyaloscypha variabilis]